MKISYDWLKEFVEFDMPPEELADTLTMFGLEALVERSSYDFSGVVVASVLSVEPIAGSDHLLLCSVTSGGEARSVVCGAPNVASGQKVPLAIAGATLPGGRVIEKTKLRGQMSEGMICAEDELGLSKDHSGIMVLDDAAEVGLDFKVYLESQREQILDLDLTPNRGDALSHIGVARDLAAKLARKVVLPDTDVIETGPPITELASVEIRDPDGCHRYAARVITGITLGPSPDWLARRITALGMRPINCVVDASNYVMMELGQPLHIFDYDRIADRRIEVYFAKAGEIFTTLDGAQRTLGNHHLLIADGEGPVALAGIMGGADSEVSDSTTNLLIESAYFTPAVIRKGSKSLELSSEASKRFERDIDIDGVITALDRVTRLINELAGGAVAKGRIDVYPRPHEPRQIELSVAFTNRLCGLELDQQTVAGSLQRFGIAVTVKDADLLHCVVPLNRPELVLDVDLIEEVARITGYDNIPTVEGVEVRFAELIADEQGYMDPIRQALVHWGFFEHLAVTMTRNTFTTLFSSAEAVQLTNPLSSELTTLRTSLLPGLLEAVAYNERRQQPAVRLFEIGAVHQADAAVYNLDRENFNLGIVMTVGIQPVGWKRAPASDLFELKGIITRLLSDCGVGAVTFTPIEATGFGAALSIASAGETIGVLGVVPPKTRQPFEIDSEVAATEIDLQSVARLAGAATVTYSEVIPYPVVERDLALELPESVPAGDLLDAIWRSGGDYLRDVRLFDLYSGDTLAPGKKSLAFRLTLQSAEGTLTDEQVEGQVEKIAGYLEKHHQAHLRRV